MTLGHPRLRLATGLLAAVLAAACGDGTSPDDAGAMDAGDAGAMDAGLDAGDGGGPGDDAGPRVDAGPGDDAAVADGGADAGDAPDAGAPDAGAADAGEVDAGEVDGGTPTPCVAAGGACVPVVPRACMGGVIGDATWYSCGGGLGVMCCLPSNTPPACRGVGTRSEGWYRPDGTRVCYAACAGHPVRCEAIGTRSEGWYTDDASAGCTAIPVDRLIEWTMCAP